jgi:uncharacterized protein
MKQFNPEDYRIFECIVGSNLYGTAIEGSDLDIRGICIPPLNVLLDPFMNFEQKDSGFKEEDRTIYAFGQFFKLCAQCNPNICEMLFVPSDKTLMKTKEWDIVLDNKQLFLSKKAKFTFTGYAISQLHRIKRHRKYFINTPKEKPTREMFGLTDAPIISGDGLKMASYIPHKFLNEKFSDEVRRELGYREAKKEWDDFISWKNARNPRRKSLEEQFGFDTIAASHLIRLMLEGKELLLEGKIIFPLQAAEEVLAIKKGKYTYDEILSMSEDMEKQFEDWYGQSSLPKAPDRNSLTKIYLDVIKNRQEE